MKATGRRAWRRAAQKMRRMHGRRWRSPDAIWGSKRWSELVPDLEAHRAPITGKWFKRHGVTEQGLQKLDAPHLVRVYVGLWGTADGDFVTYAVKPQLFTARSLVGMTQGARKRVREAIHCGERVPPFVLGTDSVTEGLRIGERLRPCLGCSWCGTPPHEHEKRVTECDGSGVLPARRKR